MHARMLCVCVVAMITASDWAALTGWGLPSCACTREHRAECGQTTRASLHTTRRPQRYRGTQLLAPHAGLSTTVAATTECRLKSPPTRSSHVPDACAPARARSEVPVHAAPNHAHRLRMAAEGQSVRHGGDAVTASPVRQRAMHRHGSDSALRHNGAKITISVYMITTVVEPPPRAAAHRAAASRRGHDRARETHKQAGQGGGALGRRPQPAGPLCRHAFGCHGPAHTRTRASTQQGAGCRGGQHSTAPPS